MKFVTTILISLLFSIALYAQDSVQHRVIFIGDAGEMNPRQQKSLQHAANHIIHGKTTVMYLGDNIYPRGMELTGSKHILETQNILQSQYKPMRAQGAPVYFVPGNHDWDKMGPKGLAKIKQQWQYLEEQGDSLLKLVPPDGCPDPVEIPIGDNMVIIAYDSEWWLFPFDKTNDDADCGCITKKDVLTKLVELRYKNRDKIILLASHHPFESYGVHGGKFTWKDHVFPLTNINKDLYIPLPGIGSLYPFLRGTFPNPEDLKHPLYKDMITHVREAFDSFPNIVYVAGHEHGLQLIKNKQLQIVSGAGAKHTNARKDKHALFADATQGYVTVDLLTGNNLRISYYMYTDDTVHMAYTYSLPYTPVAAAKEMANKKIVADSVVVSVHASYNDVGKFHRFMFGENYRKEWAAPTKLPVLRISEMHGGLTPLQLGGGMQSKSLRLVDKDGKEWVIRSVEKLPDALLPDALKNTFARDWLDDVTSGQHPFSALVAPPIANAVNVPHANPVIGVLSPDNNLGIYSAVFSNLIVLLEEREPLGESDNSEKMKKNLLKDNDNSLHAKEFLRARMLDALLGDWDRHEDQWRWYNDEKGKAKTYLAVPRDRDQVMHVTQGVIPTIASKDYILPTLRNFDAALSHWKWLLWKTRFVNAFPEMQLSRDEWKKQADKVQEAVTDSVIEEALKRLPAASYAIRHNELSSILKARRDRLSAVMMAYYDFTQKIVDIRASNKNEFVQITDGVDKGLNIRISKINKNGEVKDELMNKTYEASKTKEIRLYLGNGNDSVVIDNKSSYVKLRIVGGDDKKTYNIINSENSIRLYDKDNNSTYSGNVSRLNKHVSNDSANTAFAQTNLYNVWMPLAMIGINIDDGFILGAGFKYTRQEGFRKTPYASSHQFIAGHSFSTKAYRIRYSGEWIHAIGNADLTLQALIKAPNNTINFFGRGNETVYDKSQPDSKTYYRTRYSAYLLDPAFRWRSAKGSAVSIGPSLYYYAFDSDDNEGRFINNTAAIGSYDSLTVNQNKLHLGGSVTYLSDRRNSKIIPQWGSYVSLKIQAYKGVGEYAADFMQVIPEVALYKSLNPRATIVLAERMGGTISVGKTTFYQSAYIGGHENLLGYRQYRFAGQHSFYNNLELRIKVADVANYILPGQLGITGFWDIGRVWETPDNSNKWHNGVGGGIYFAPASMLSFNFVMGYSPEGWYPYFTMGFRF